MMKPPEKISVIMPVHNEKGKVAESVGRVSAFMEKFSPDFEIIIVDDGSGPETRGVLEKLAKKNSRLKVLYNEKNFGKGYSVKRGALASNGKYVLFTDADLSAPISQVKKLMQYSDGGFDVVIGSRLMPDSKITVSQSFHRGIFGYLFRILTNLLIINGLSDTQCGFKLFKNGTVKKIFAKQTLDGFAFDVELLLIAKSNGMKIKEVGVEWGDYRKSQLNIFNAPISMFADLIRIKRNSIRGIYRID
ncbi:Glycosyltransferase AglD [uncultured archaeon]|nr:Glycosyltransferase AglD [uncultured archaeon]